MLFQPRCGSHQHNWCLVFPGPGGRLSFHSLVWMGPQLWPRGGKQKRHGSTARRSMDSLPELFTLPSPPGRSKTVMVPSASTPERLCQTAPHLCRTCAVFVINLCSEALISWGVLFFFFNCNIILLSELKPKDMHWYLLLLVLLFVLFVHQAVELSGSCDF